MPIGNSQMGYFGLALETTPNTPVTTPDFFYPLEEGNIAFQNEFIDIQEIRGNRQAYSVQDGPIRPEVTMRGAVYPAGGLALLLKGLFGKVTSAPAAGSTTAYDHTFSDALLPTITVERSTAFATEASTIYAERVAGCKVESFGLDVKFGDLVEFNSTLQATGIPNSVATPVARASVVWPLMKAMYFGGASIKVDGADNQAFESLKIEVKNKLERLEPLRGENTTLEISEGGVDCTLSGTLLFSDLDMYTKLINGTEFAVEMNLTNKQEADTTTHVFYNLKLTWPKVRIAKHDVPFKAGDILRADVDFRVLYDPATDQSVGAVLTNDEDGTNYA